jgi:para-nitrobenzyl esterase
MRLLSGSIAFLTLVLLGCGSSSSSADPTPDAGSDGGIDAIAPDGGDASGACTITATAAPGTVVTSKGAVHGAHAGKTWSYLGIPYAAPPVGPLRWKPPAEASCFAGTREATAYGKACVQQNAAGAIVGDEDCLSINVWIPEDATPSAKLPVMVFLHGGANIEGQADLVLTDGKTHLYDPQPIVERAAVIVVTLNYRLGAFGFLANAALADATTKASGDYGLHDQLAALRWVQKEIASFGGDPARVMLFGESAGAIDAALLYASPRAAGLFKVVALESGAFGAQKKDAAEAYGQKLVSAAGCEGKPDVAACLRALSAEAIAKALPQKFDLSNPLDPIFSPSVDGDVVPDQPLTLIAAGKHNAAALLVGSNSDEMGLGIPELTEDQYRARVETLAGSAVARDFVLAQYPSSEWGSPRKAYVALLTDSVFTCQARKMARAATKGQSQPVYRYFFTHALENGGDLVKSYGAFHALELSFVFHHLDANAYVPSAGEVSLADTMTGAWTRFATSGDPNGGGMPTWPRYDVATDPYLQLDTTVKAGAALRTKQCDFWDTVAP